MLNLLLGDAGPEDSRLFIDTVAGRKGHAIYGPYEVVEPGRYAVSFELERTGNPNQSSDPLCVVLDVVTDAGRSTLARKEIHLSQLDGTPQRFRLPFDVEKRMRLEYRVWVSGACALRIGDHRRVQSLDASGDPAQDMDAGLFPEAGEGAPPFFNEQIGSFRQLYDRGAAIRFDEEGTIVTIEGVSFYARCPDDMNFVGEVFFERVYNFVADATFCVIDIGMNIGLSSLMFAAEKSVREVHGFEPFASTYDRAVDNIALNGAFSAKITPHNFGLSDADWSGELRVGGGSDSGANSVVSEIGGTPVFMNLKDSGAILGPILTAARANGLRTMVKVDCEGSEFRVFDALARDGLFGLVDTMAVEWHDMFDDKSRHDLFAPLRAAGFLIFDRSPRSGNGFFYAVRMAQQ